MNLLCRFLATATLATATLATATLLLAQGAIAQSWPERPVRLIVPVAAGSSVDITARLLADKLGGMWSQRVVVENLGGSGGIPGMNALIRAKGDGYTFGFLPGSSVMVTPALYKSAQINVERDLVPVALIATSPFMIAVNPKSDIRSIGDLVREARSNPGKLNIAVLPINTAVHLGAEMFNSAAGIKLHVIPYKGAADALLSTISGETQVVLAGVPAVVPLLKDGRLRVLAVTTRERLPGYENIPSAHDTVPGFEVNSWFGLFAPAGAPSPVVARVNRDVNAVLKLPDIAARYEAAGVYPAPGLPESLKNLIESDGPKWTKIVKEFGVVTD